MLFKLPMCNICSNNIEYCQDMTNVLKTWRGNESNENCTGQRKINKETKQNMIWYDMRWYNMIWYNIIWYGMVWYGMIWYDITWYDMIWCDMIWYNMIWDDITWYDII